MVTSTFPVYALPLIGESAYQYLDRCMFSRSMRVPKGECFPIKLRWLVQLRVHGAVLPGSGGQAGGRVNRLFQKIESSLI